MSDNEDVTIRVKRDTWHELNIRKGPGDSFDDVIRGLLEEDEEGNPTPTPIATAD